MHRGRGRARARPGYSGSPRNKTPLKGLFKDNKWLCNCEPRLPADKFQTKNGGKNHGRWFYTCQKPQHVRCNFFLWEDEAQLRSASAVLNNSRSEPRGRMPRSPSPTVRAAERARSRRALSGAQVEQEHSELPFQHSDLPYRSAPWLSVRRDQKAANGSDDDEEEEFFDWPLTGEEESQLVHSATEQQQRHGLPNKSTLISSPPETPRKAPRTNQFSSPGAQSQHHLSSYHNSGEAAAAAANQEFAGSPISTNNLFSTPSSSSRSGPTSTSAASVFPTPQTTPSKRLAESDLSAADITTPTPPSRYKDAALGDGGSSMGGGAGGPIILADDSSLATDVFQVLSRSPSDLSPETRRSLKRVLNSHALRTQGIVKGRNITRLALKARDVRIADLQYRIASLEAERESDRAVIAHLRRLLQGNGQGAG
ncbi:MAG: hypothetical protein M1819_004971 [Sarea resinae]|nr:MAG: hypothetical protein M1819_004971 [Sarea resinae]